MNQPSIIAKSSMIFGITLDLTEAEARALADVTAYQAELVVTAIQKATGARCIKEQEKVLCSMIERIRAKLPGELDRMDKVRKLWNGEAT